MRILNPGLSRSTNKLRHENNKKNSTKGQSAAVGGPIWRSIDGLTWIFSLSLSLSLSLRSLLFHSVSLSPLSLSLLSLFLYLGLTWLGWLSPLSSLALELFSYRMAMRRSPTIASCNINNVKRPITGNTAWVTWMTSSRRRPPE